MLSDKEKRIEGWEGSSSRAAPIVTPSVTLDDSLFKEELKKTIIKAEATIAGIGETIEQAEAIIERVEEKIIELYDYKDDEDVFSMRTAATMKQIKELEKTRRQAEETIAKVVETREEAENTIVEAEKTIRGIDAWRAKNEESLHAAKRTPSDFSIEKVAIIMPTKTQDLASKLIETTSPTGTPTWSDVERGTLRLTPDSEGAISIMAATALASSTASGIVITPGTMRRTAAASSLTKIPHRREGYLRTAANHASTSTVVEPHSARTRIGKVENPGREEEGELKATLRVEASNSNWLNDKSLFSLNKALLGFEVFLEKNPSCETLRQNNQASTYQLTLDSNNHYFVGEDTRNLYKQVKNRIIALLKKENMTIQDLVAQFPRLYKILIMHMDTGVKQTFAHVFRTDSASLKQAKHNEKARNTTPKSR